MFVATGFDGYIARVDGGLDWLPGTPAGPDVSGEDHGYDAVIADMVITRVPVLLGAGLPLFGALPADVRLRHEGPTAFPSGLVQSRHVVV